jgi:hypothetical protein
MITGKQENKAMIATFRQHAFMMFVVGIMFGFIIGKLL